MGSNTTSVTGFTLTRSGTASSSIMSNMPRIVAPPQKRGWLEALAVATGTAFAANQTCPNGLPFCFAPDSPALAGQVNMNFMQLKEWVETKVGPVSTGGVSSGTVTAATVTASGTVTAATVTASGTVNANVVSANVVSANGVLRANALVAARGLEIDWNRTGGVGETDFSNFREGGVGGFNFYNGANTTSARTLVMAIDSAGSVSVPGTVTDNSAAARKFLLADICGDVAQTTMCPANMYVCGLGIWNGEGCKRVVCCRLGHNGVSL